MANNILSMNKIRQLLRLYDRGASKMTISQYVGVSRTTVRKYIIAIESSGCSTKEIDELSDSDLDTLFGSIISKPVSLSKRMQTLQHYFPKIEKELKRTGMTRILLWEDYISEFPNGYQYTQFCQHFRTWQSKMNPTMHRTHKVGDKLFVDFAGEKLSYADRDTGEVHEVEVFVAILGASQLTYVEAVPSQQKEDFIIACENTMHYIGGVPAAFVPDNLKAAVTKSHRYEPTLNQSFEDFASHYDTCVLPARAYKPRDKALVEGAVRIAYTRIYVPIRKQVYHSLPELNAAILVLLEKHNDQLMKGRIYSRRMQFEEIERKELKPLPLQRFEQKQQFYVKVNKDSHVLLGPDRHYYSVPVRLLGKKVKIMYSVSTVEIFFKFERVAVHPRNKTAHGFTTNTSHLTSIHRYSAERSAQTLLKRASAMHEHVHDLIKGIAESHRHDDQKTRLCEAILGLEKKYGGTRLAAACRRVSEYGIDSKLFKTIDTILEQNLEDQRENLFANEMPMPSHQNIRGEEYYK
ncbi:IS21 family transposase [Pedobacter frigoris]|uniref:IS21 family transposase n=2 Tax=Pedobacter frigoris TaxID=2571272 RepID=A0A4U1CMS3_9SPHI|nr:IS21 family transposase [Pedobacter frigoris]